MAKMDKTIYVVAFLISIVLKSILKFVICKNVLPKTDSHLASAVYITTCTVYIVQYAYPKMTSGPEICFNKNPQFLANFFETWSK